MPKRDNLKREKQNNINQLKHVLGTDSKKNAKQAEDISEIHKHNGNHSNRRINRYLAISLVKLANNRTENISYNTSDTKKDISAKQNSNNELALLESLKSIKFIKVLKTTSKKNKTIKNVSITPLGKKYVKEYIHHNHRIYKYLKYGKSSMKRTQKGKRPENLRTIIKHQFILVIFSIFFVLATLFSAFFPNVHHSKLLQNVKLPIPAIDLNYYSVIFTAGIAALMILIVIIMIIAYALVKKSFHANENIKKDIKNATRLNFVKFLKTHHTKEPDYRFGYNNNLPKISYYLFNNKNKKGY